MRKPINLLVWDMQFFLYKSMLKTAGTLCSKIKDLNSNCAEYKQNLYLGYLKANTWTLLFLCKGLPKWLPRAGSWQASRSQHLALTCLRILGCRMISEAGRGWKVEVKEVSLFLYVRQEWHSHILVYTRPCFVLQIALSRAPRLKQALYIPILQPPTLHQGRHI